MSITYPRIDLYISLYDLKMFIANFPFRFLFYFSLVMHLEELQHIVNNNSCNGNSSNNSNVILLAMPIIIYKIDTDVPLTKCQLLALIFLLTISKQQQKSYNNKLFLWHTTYFTDISTNIRRYFVTEYILPLDSFNLYLF